MKTKRIIALMLCAVLALCAFPGVSPAEEVPAFRVPQSAVNWVRKNKPASFSVENVNWSPADIYKIFKALPEGASFHFETDWGGVPVSESTVELDLREKKGGVTGADLEAVCALCPNLALVDNSSRRSPSNKEMIPLIEKYPGIRFEWVVHLGGAHYISTHDTAFSTFNEPFDPDSLSSKQMEKLKYCPRLKALDLGHNRLTDLEFLQYVPDLELLIVGDNMIKDLTPISQLKHLKYAELFSNYFTDLAPVAACTELLDLNICYARVPDFRCLDDMPALERFWATNTDRYVTDEEKERFRQVHPNTECDFKGSHATTNGWRSHPRYHHYIWCLRNRTWIPFDQPLPDEAGA